MQAHNQEGSRGLDDPLTVKNGELGYTLGREFNKHPLLVRYFMYTHWCIYHNLSFIVGWSNILKGVYTFGVHRYTFKGGTIIKHKSILYFSNFVTKYLTIIKTYF